MEINLTKINDKLFNIDGINKKITFKNILVPFKLSNYNNNYYLSIEINQNDKLNIEKLNNYKTLESLIFKQDEICENDISNLEFYSNIKTKKFKNNNLDLIRLHIKKGKNTIITKYNNGKSILFDIQPQKKYNVEIEIGTLWISKKNYGIQLNLININDI